MQPKRLAPHFTPLDLKSLATDGVFEGYASLFHREDLAHDIILPGAFTESLSKRGAGNIKLLYQHDPAEPIGVWDSIVEDARGLRVRGRLLPGVARAREVLSLMRAGAIDGLSIGFRAVSGKRDARSRIRKLAKVDLWEISIVTFPMLPGARISTVKSRGFSPATATAQEFERWLTNDNGFTRAEATAFLANGLKGLLAHHAPANAPHRLRSSIQAATQLLQH
jgi:HK97 family phage prohead protease